MESFAYEHSNPTNVNQNTEHPGNKKKAPSFKEILAEKTFLPRIGTHDNVIKKNGKKFWCSLCSCQLQLKELKPHVVGKKHNQILKDCRWLEKCIDKEKPLSQLASKDDEEPSPPGVELPDNTSGFQDTIDKFVSRPLLGLEYILEIVYESKLKPSLYLCTLCHRKGNISMALSHMTGYYHTVLYIKKHFPTAFGHFECKNVYDIHVSLKPVLTKLARTIEAKYGRLKLTRVNAEKFWDNETQYFKTLHEGQHLSESSGETFENYTKEELAKVSGYRPNVNLKGLVGIEDRQREVPCRDRKIDDYANNFEAVYNLSKDISGRSSVNLKDMVGNEDLQREVPIRDRKIDDYANKLEVFYKLAKDIDGEMEQLLIKHKENPEDHPQYNEEWKKFWKERYRDLQLRGIDPSSYDFKSEWKEFWNKRILKLHDEETESKKMVLRRMLNLQDEPTPSFASFNKDREVVLRDDDSVHSRNSSRKRYRSRSPQKHRDLPSRHRGSPHYRELSPPHKRTRFSQSTSSRFSPPPRHSRFSPPSPYRSFSPPHHRSISPPFKESSFVERDFRKSPCLRRDSPSRYREHIDSPPRFREPRDSPSRYREHIDSPPRFREPRDSPSRFRETRDTPGYRESPRYTSGTRDSSPFREPEESHYLKRKSPHRIKEFRDSSPCFRELRYSPPDLTESHSLNKGSFCSGESVSFRNDSALRREVSPHFREPSPCFKESSFSRRDYNSYSEYERNRGRYLTTEKEDTDRVKKLCDEPSRFIRESSEIVKNKQSEKSRESQDKSWDVTRNLDKSESKIVTLLRLLTGLEKRLGSLGPKVIGLLSNALIMENDKFNSSEKLLEDESNCLLLETVREKLKGHLQAGLVHGIQRDIFNTAVEDIETVLYSARQKKEPKNLIDEPDIVLGEKDKQPSIIIDITSDDEFSTDNKISARNMQENKSAPISNTNKSSTRNINIISGIPGGSITINEFSIGGTFGNAQNFYGQNQARHKEMMPQQDTSFQFKKNQPLPPSAMNPYAIDVENSGSGDMMGFNSSRNAKWSMGSSLLVKPIGFPNKEQNVNIPSHTKQTFSQMGENTFRGRGNESLFRGGPLSNQPMSKDSSFVWRGEQSHSSQERGGDLRGEMTEPRREFLNIRDELLNHREITTGLRESLRPTKLVDDYRNISNFKRPPFNDRGAF